VSRSTMRGSIIGWMCRNTSDPILAGNSAIVLQMLVKEYILTVRMDGKDEPF
jgi:hypothetical protein